MPWWAWVPVAAAAITLATVAQLRGWIDLRGTGNGRGSGNGAFGMLDEAFHPTKHEAQQVLAQQSEAPAPAPVPGDGPFDLDASRVRIVLPEDPHPERDG